MQMDAALPAAPRQFQRKRGVLAASRHRSRDRAPVPAAPSSRRQRSTRRYQPGASDGTRLQQGKLRIAPRQPARSARSRAPGALRQIVDRRARNRSTATSPSPTSASWPRYRSPARSPATWRAISSTASPSTCTSSDGGCRGKRPLHTRRPRRRGGCARRRATPGCARIPPPAPPVLPLPPHAGQPPPRGNDVPCVRRTPPGQPVCAPSPRGPPAPSASPPVRRHGSHAGSRSSAAAPRAAGHRHQFVHAGTEQRGRPPCRPRPPARCLCHACGSLLVCRNRSNRRVGSDPEPPPEWSAPSPRR